MQSVNEGSSSTHSLDIRGFDGSVITPILLRYKLTNSKGTILTDWTTIDNASTSLVISGTLNSILTSASIGRLLTIEATDSDSNKITSEFYYEITNLVGI
jgi:hypothetical protein